MERSELEVIDLQRRYGLNFAEAHRLKADILQRENDLLDEVEKPLKEAYNSGVNNYLYWIKKVEQSRSTIQRLRGEG